MSVSLTVAKKLVTNVLNENDVTTYGTLTNPERYVDGEVTDACLSADAAICRAIIETPGHGRRKDFLTSATVAHGAQIATHVGPVESIIFAVTGGAYAGTRAGNPAGKDEIERDNRNPLALTLIEPAYYLEGDTVYHNAAGLVAGGASSVTVTAAYCTFTLTSACQSSDEMERAVVLAAVALLIGKDGHHTAAAAGFEAQYRQEMANLGVAGVQPLMAQGVGA